MLRISSIVLAVLASTAATHQAHAQAAFLGCFKDRAVADGGRDLGGFTFNSTNMNSALCMNSCRTRGFRFAGTQYASQCWCGNAYGAIGTATNCNMKCSGNPSEICGGFFANSVYQAQ